MLRPERSLEQERATITKNRTAHDAIVKDITTLRAKRMTLRAIAEDLNARGIPTVHGRHWAAQVRDVLNRARG